MRAVFLGRHKMFASGLWGDSRAGFVSGNFSAQHQARNYNMKLNLLSWAIAGTLCTLATSAGAATLVSLQNDSGPLQLQTFVPPAIPSSTLTNPYGAPPLPPIVTLPNGIVMSFIVTSDF